jgi:immune inhibitor A
LEDRVRKLITVLSSVALLVSLTAGAVSAAPQAKNLNKSDNLPGPKAIKQQELKKTAIDLVMRGKATPTGANQVVEVAKGQFVELAFEGEDQILTLLAEFGDADPTHNHGGFGNITHTGDALAHNSIPEPDRSVDNTTIWVDDFSQAYYDTLLYDKGLVPSMANWYLAASDGRYSVDGYVGPWVEVPNNPSAYGSNYCGSIVCTRDVGRFLLDQGVAWYDQMVADGMTAEEINDLLAPFDVWDRYDYDGDGDFDEPDGYIDHYQSVHAGEGEETGGGALGEDAIWSHRSYANAGFAGTGLGPTVINDEGDPEVVPFEGAPLGDSNYWIGDYTVEPENGGVGVFGHEFGHDLGLPDLYDTSGNTGGAENSTAWWTMWSQGSYGTITDDLGSYPVAMSAWEKLFLGWLNYEVAFPGVASSHKLSAININTKQAQALAVILPPKEVSTFVGDPYAGDFFYHSGAGNDLDNTMTRSISLGAGPITLSFQARYQIEACWDYAYVQVSTNGGSTWTNLNTSASTNDDPNGQNDGNGITGTSGHTPTACDTFFDAEWANVTADLSAYANQSILLRFRYWTDVAVVGEGFGVDEISITGLSIDGGETDLGWDYDGFVRTDGTVTSVANHYYIAEYRNYKGYDQALKVGPYNFVDPAGTEGLPNWVEHFPYQDGLLIWYYDTSQSDNNVGDHPGEGLLLPIDAHPDILHWSDGSTARPRIQGYDSTFSMDKTDPLSLHNLSAGLTLTRSSLPAVSLFNDMLSYYRTGDPGDNGADGRYQSEWASVNNPHTGTKIKVVGVSAAGSFIQIVVLK